jgi:biotin carboxyl carrier protein
VLESEKSPVCYNDSIYFTLIQAGEVCKMPYISTVNDHVYRIDTGENNPQREITIDGSCYKIDWRNIAPFAAEAKVLGGHYSLLIEGKSYEIFARRIIQPGDENGQLYEILFGEQRFEVRVEDEREKALAGSVKSARVSGEAKVRAPMPGLVIGIPLEVGASVTQGQTVIVLEAMKMENDLAAPRAGTIKEIKVSQGQTVNQGDVLVVIN